MQEFQEKIENVEANLTKHFEAMNAEQNTDVDDKLEVQKKDLRTEIERGDTNQRTHFDSEMNKSKIEVQDQLKHQKSELQKEIKDGDTNLKEHFNAKIHDINKELAYLEPLEINSINGTLNDHMSEFFLSQAQFEEITDKINANLGGLESTTRNLLNESEARGQELLGQEKSYLQADMATKLDQVKHRLYRQRDSFLHEIEMGDKRIQVMNQLDNEMKAKINGVENDISDLETEMEDMGEKLEGE